MVCRVGKRRLVTLSQGGGGLPYTGQVATRSYLPNSFHTPHKEAVSDSVHFLRDSITGIQLVLANWYVNIIHVESTPASAATFRASVEYPSDSGNWTPATFSGASSVSCAAGNNAVTDVIQISVNSGTAIKVRIEQKSTAGILYIGNWTPANQQTIMGDRFRSVASGLPDYMGGGTFTSTDTLVFLTPVAIVGTTKKASVALHGDSRMWGQYDTSDASGDLGEVARSIGPRLGYINFGDPGAKAATFKNGATKRAALTNTYCSHVVCEYGGSDLNQTADSAETINGYIDSIQALFPGKTFFQTTSTPQTTSTDNWVTVANQSVKALETRRLALNTLSRARQYYFDTTAGIEAAGGKWSVSPTNTAYTGDGIHGNKAGYLAIQNSGVIDPSRLRR